MTELSLPINQGFFPGRSVVLIQETTIHGITYTRSFGGIIDVNSYGLIRLGIFGESDADEKTITDEFEFSFDGDNNELYLNALWNEKDILSTSDVPPEKILGIYSDYDMMYIRGSYTSWFLMGHGFDQFEKWLDGLGSLSYDSTLVH